MKNFLLIVPPGWELLDWETISTTVPGMDAESVKDLIASEQWGSIEVMLRGEQLIPNGVIVVEAKLVDDSVFLVRLAPLVEPT